MRKSRLTANFNGRDHYAACHHARFLR